MAGISKVQNRKALSRQDARQAGPAIRRRVLAIGTARTTMEHHDGKIGIHLGRWRIENALDIPVIAVAVIAGESRPFG